MASGTNNTRRALDLTETPPTSPGVARITVGVERIVLDNDRRLVQAQAELAAATQATLDAEAEYQRTPRFNEAARSAAFAQVNANSKRVRELTAEIERLRRPVGVATPTVPRTPVLTAPTTPVRTTPTTPVVVPRTPIRTVQEPVQRNDLDPRLEREARALISERAAALERIRLEVAGTTFLDRTYDVRGYVLARLGEADGVLQQAVTELEQYRDLPGVRSRLASVDTTLAAVRSRIDEQRVLARTPPAPAPEPRVEPPQPRLSAAEEARLRRDIENSRRAYQEAMAELESASSFDRSVERFLDEERELRRLEAPTRAVRTLEMQAQLTQDRALRVRAAVNRAIAAAKERIEQRERGLAPELREQALDSALRAANLVGVSARERDRLLFYAAYAAALAQRVNRAEAEQLLRIEALERELADLNNELRLRFPNNQLLIDAVGDMVGRQTADQSEYRRQLAEYNAAGRSPLLPYLARTRFLEAEIDQLRKLRAELIASEQSRAPPTPVVVVPPAVQPVVHALQAENEAGEARADVQADNVVALRDHVQRENAAEQVAVENRARNNEVVGGLLQYARDTVSALVRRADGGRAPAPAAVNQAVAAIDNVAQAVADQNADERAEAERRASAQAAVEAEQRANEENLDLVVVIPSEARFPRLGASGDDVGDDPNTFIARTFANGGDFVEWTPGAPGQFRLRNIQTRTIAWVFERLFGPILDEWWRTDTHHTYHWMNTIIPFTTALALAFRSAVVKAEATDTEVPETLARASLRFKNMVLFALMKALTGLEAEIEGRGVPNKQEPPAPRQPSEFEVDENYTNNPTVVTWLRDATTRNQLRVGAPVVEMIFGIQDSMERRELSLDFAGNFSRLFEATSVEDEDRLKMEHVRFAELASDEPPPRGGVASPSLQSFESRLSRIMGLPVLDVLYADDAAAFGVSPEDFMLQDVRGLIDERLFARLGTLPSFFTADPPQRGLQVASRDGDNEVELIVGLLREAAAAAALAPATGRSRRGGRRGGRGGGAGAGRGGRRGRGGVPEELAPASTEELLASFRSARGRNEINRLFAAVARPPTNVEELEIFERLAFPVLLTQLANIRGLWDASLAGTDDLRRPLAFKLLAGALFQNVALNTNDVEEFEAEEDKSGLDYSFFGRIALRPKYTVFVANPESEMPRAESRYLETAARPERGGGGRRRRSKSMGAGMDRGRAVVASDASLSSIFERPRITLPKLSKSIAQNRAIGSQVYQYVTLVREFDEELRDELDSEIEPMRTVLVPTDRALAQFRRSREFAAATSGLNKDERDQYLIDVLRYHVLARQIDFTRLLKDRVRQSLVPTELEIELAGGEERNLQMQIEVVSNEEARDRGLALYNDKTGGTLRINAESGDTGSESLYVIGGKQRARNGDYYIINRVIDSERAKELGLEGRSLRRGNAARPRGATTRAEQVRAGEEFEAEDVFRDVETDDEEEEEEQRRVRFAQTAPERLRAPPRTTSTGVRPRETAEQERERLELWLESAQADYVDTYTQMREEPERRAELLAEARLIGEQIARVERRLAQLAEAPIQRMPTGSKAVEASLAAASQQRATKTLAKAQENNEKDFEPMKRMLAVSGVRQEIIEARCAGKNVYVLAPTREALRRAGIDVDQMSDDEVRSMRDFVRSHVLRADWESESAPGRRMRGPMMPQDFIWMLQQRNRTPVRTLVLENSGASAAAAETIHYVPLHERTKPTVPEHEHAQLHIDDLQLDRPQHTYAGDKDVFVYFLNRTLVAPKAAAPQQQQKASGAPAKEAAVTSTQAAPAAAPGGAKINWTELASSVERALKTNTNQAAYHDDVLRFGRAIDELGGPKKVASAVPIADVDRTFERLHTAISRNQHIGTEHKTKAHDALDQMFARF